MSRSGTRGQLRANVEPRKRVVNQEVEEIAPLANNSSRRCLKLHISPTLLLVSFLSKGK